MSASRIEPTLAIPLRFQPHLEALLPQTSINWYSNARECRDAVRNADVLWIGMGTPSTSSSTEIAEIVEVGTRLQWIHSHGAGTERHPLALYGERGLIFTNGSGISSIPIAEHVVMVMLAAAKRLPEHVRAQERSEWLSKGPTATELAGTQALIIGYGAIGTAIGDRLRPFGVRVVGVRRRPQGEPGIVGPDEWRSQLHASDWVILSVILTGETLHLVGATEFASMLPTTWLINVSRGAVVDQPALVSALRSRQIAGACLDVTDPEPLPPESPLWAFHNVIITPHSSWSSSNFDRRAASLFLELLEQFRNGSTLRNRVDLDVGHRVT